MFIPPTYQFTKKITQHLSDIEKLKTELNLTQFNPKILRIKRRASLLKSSLFSAKIEGNTNNIHQLNNSSWEKSKDMDKLEISNILRALEYVLGNNWQDDIKIKDLKAFHSLITNNISSDSGYLRTEPSAIYNIAGVAVYICPLPSELNDLLLQLLRYINGNFESFIPIKAALTHHVFEKIHPFLDGNGRVGRLLMHLVMKKWDYDLKGLAPFEEFIDKYRSDYYDLIAVNRQDQTEFVEFILEGFVWALKEAKSTMAESIFEFKPEDELPLRRGEILKIIRDHRVVSFDFLKRRFMLIPQRTLRYDLMMLAKKNFINKRGVTRGTMYEIND